MTAAATVPYVCDHIEQAGTQLDGPQIDPSTAATTAPWAAVWRLEIQPGEHHSAGIILLPYGAQPG
jgi:hypothetical protein